MRHKNLKFIIALITLSWFWSTAFCDDVTRLSPDSFHELPKFISADLKERGCTIPQTYISTTPHNVVSLDLEGNNQTSWVVLCSQNEKSVVLVYWDGNSAPAATPFKSGPDRNYVQSIGNGRFGYSRYLSVVHPAEIQKRHPEFHATHDGLEVSFLEKASTIYYRENGKWLTLAGSD